MIGIGNPLKKICFKDNSFIKGNMKITDFDELGYVYFSGEVNVNTTGFAFYYGDYDKCPKNPISVDTFQCHFSQIKYIVTSCTLNKFGHLVKMKIVSDEDYREKNNELKEKFMDYKPYEKPEIEELMSDLPNE